MKLKAALLFASIIFSHQLIGQTLSPIVISTAGGFSANGTAMLSSTVGEMSMVETFVGANVILTQGFQQPEDFNVSVEDMDHISGGITLGPNPTRGSVHIVFSNNEALKLNISVYDATGRIIFRNAEEKQAGNNFVLLNFSSLACGEYILDCKISGSSNNQPGSFSRKISVIN